MIGGLWSEAAVVAIRVTWPRVRAWWIRNEVTWLLAALLALVALLLQQGCATRTVYVDRPGPERVVERPVYVAIPDALLPTYPIASGPLQQCPIVARDRKTTLIQAQANTDAIRKIRGQPAEAVATP